MVAPLRIKSTFFLKVPRPGANLGSFWFFVYFLSLKQRLRPLGYCAPHQDSTVRQIVFWVKVKASANANRSSAVFSLKWKKRHLLVFISAKDLALQLVHKKFFFEICLFFWQRSAQFSLSFLARICTTAKKQRSFKLSCLVYLIDQYE